MESLRPTSVLTFVGHGDALPARIGSHEVIERLGAGGACEVLLARTRGPRGFTRLVVLKRLRATHASDPAYIADLSREALAYARLDHPAIVHLFEVIEDQGRPVLVLQYVHGLSLHRLRAQLRGQRETLGDEVAMYVMHDVFAALAAAHEARDPETGELAQVVHRDVSPANILIDWGGAVRLTDFGLAKLAGDDADTSVGLLKGTHGYMAPEQIIGAPVSVRTDIYSACLLLRELLLRRPAFAGGSATELELMADMAHPSLPPIEKLRTGVPPKVAAALRIGLSPSPEARTLTAADVRDVLAASVDAPRARRQLVALLKELRPKLASATEAQTLVTRHRDPIPSEPPDSVRALTRTDPCHELPPRTGVSPASRATIARLGAIALGALAATAITIGAIRVASIHLSHGVRVAVAARAQGIRKLSSPLSSLFLSRPPPPDVEPLAPPAAPDPSAPSVVAAPDVSDRAQPDAASLIGVIVTPPTRVAHRVFVDGRVVGSTMSEEARHETRCGHHLAKIGAHGVLHDIEVPCGGETVLAPRW